MELNSLSSDVCQEDGIRFFMSVDGVVRQITTPWLMVRKKFFLKDPHVCLPADKIDGGVELKLPELPPKLFHTFLKEAKSLLPAEAAGWLILNQKTNAWRLEMSKVCSASANHINYIAPTVGVDEVAIVDMHTHGLGRAFFSSVDNTDDRGAIKIAVVFGSLGPDQKMTVMARLVVIDQFITLGYENGKFVVRPSVTGAY